MTWVTNPYRFGSAALQIIRTFGDFSTPSVNSGSVTFPLPSGSAGQLLVVILGFRGAPTFTAPAGWTIVYQVTNAATGDFGLNSFLYAYKIRGASEATPTFTRSGGNIAAGAITGYQPSGGGFAYETFSANTGVSFRPQTAAISPAGGNRLIVVGGTVSFLWNVPEDTFGAVSLAATRSSGVLVPPTATPVMTSEWGNLFWTTRTNASVDTGTQGFDLFGVPAGSTGLLAFADPIQDLSEYQLVAGSFAWSP